MASFDIKFTGKIDRRSPFNEGDLSSPILRQNWLSRNGRLSKPRGHEVTFTDLPDTPRWMTRYTTIETGISPSEKTFVYTQDGAIHVLDDSTSTFTTVKTALNTNARPRHWLFKIATQTLLFFVDGVSLLKHDGNNDNTFDDVSIIDANGDSVKPIDLIEHKDRLFVISNTSLFVSKNLAPTVFDDATDSIEIIVGSGKGKNLAVGKIEDRLYIFNTEGIFILDGDVISALASTFEVRLVDERRIVAGGTVMKVEKAILFLADDYELWSWDGSTTQMLSFELKLKDFIFQSPTMLNKATAIYNDNYYKMSFVQGGDAEPNTEVWWDAFENKIDIVQGRRVSCYMQTDPTVEAEYVQFGKSNAGIIATDNRTNDFAGSAIATRLRTRDLTPKKGFNVRFTAFYPEFMPTGNRNIQIAYLLDGRSSNPTGAGAIAPQSLRGEIKTIAGLPMSNQSQFTGRIRPRINYARGESIAFEIIEATAGLKCDLVGMRIEYIAKHSSKSNLVGA